VQRCSLQFEGAETIAIDGADVSHVAAALAALQARLQVCPPMCVVAFSTRRVMGRTHTRTRTRTRARTGTRDNSVRRPPHPRAAVCRPPPRSTWTTRMRKSVMMVPVLDPVLAALHRKRCGTTHTSAHTHARTHTRTLTHARTHTRTHKHTRTHAHGPSVLRLHAAVGASDAVSACRCSV
jgi:hypothetical protein